MTNSIRTIFVIAILFLILDFILYYIKGSSKLIFTFSLLSLLIIFSILFFIHKTDKYLNTDQKIDSRYQFVLSSIFFILTIFSGLTIVSRPYQYERPLPFFILSAFSIATVSLHILYSHKKSSSFLLLEIIFLGWFLRLVPLSLIPGLYGTDPLYHQMFTLKILDNGHIPLYEEYTPFPMMHMTIASLMMISNLEFKNAVILSVIFMDTTLVPILLFLISYKIFGNYKVGLFAAILFIFSNMTLGFSIWGAFPTLFAIPMVLIIIYILLKGHPRLSIFFMIVLIMSHSLTPLFILLFLIIFFTLNKILKKHNIDGNYITFFFIFMIFYWTYSADFILSRFVKTIFFEEPVHTFLTAVGSQYSQTVPLHEYLFSFTGDFIFFSLVTIGVLYIITKKNTSAVFVLSSLFPLCIAGIYILTSGEVPERWLYYGYIMSSISAGFGIQFIMNVWSSNTVKIFLMSAIMIVLSFLMITHPFSNIDSPIYSKDITVQKYLTIAELQSVNTISEKYNGTIGSADIVLDYYLSFMKNMRFEKIDLYDKSHIYENEIIILIRENPQDRPTGIGKMYKVNYSIFSNEGLYKVYDSKSIVGFYKHI